MFDVLARLAHRRARLVLVLSAVLTVVALGAGGPLTSTLSSGGFDDPSSESIQTRDRLEEASGVTPGAGVIALVSPGSDVRTGPGRAAVERVAATIAEDAAIARVITPYGPGGEPQISTDGTQAYVIGQFRPGDDDFRVDGAQRIEETFADDDQVKLGGQAVVGNQVTDTISSDLARAEAIALPVVFLLSLWVFRGIVAALLMPLMGAIAIFVSFFAIGLANLATTMSVFCTNLVIALGLGLAVDYSLLIITRYREELARRGPGFDAIAVTLRTAGKSIVFSAVTVAAALAGLMLFPVNFLFSMGLGGFMAALIAGATAVIVLPAVLALLGQRVNAGAPKRWQRQTAQAELASSGPWYRLSRFVMARPAIIAIVTGGVLLLVASPLLGIKFTSVDATVLPPSASARQVAETIQQDFPEDLSDAAILAIQTPGDGREEAARVAGFASELEGLEGVEAVIGPVPVGEGVFQVNVLPEGEVLSAEAQAMVEDLRTAPAPYDTLVGGPTAEFIDQEDAILRGLPWAILVIAVVTLVALFIMTGSVLLPLKAVLLNILSISATLGILVWIFQDGNLEGLLNFDSRGAIGLTQPILLGAVAFGLSTDYAVFLLSRIKELRDGGMENDEAVAVGLQRTGRVVTAAALLYAVAVGAFALSDIVILKEIGVGNALAVLIDASIIRALLVPALMAMLGEWNWWAPRPLRRLHDRIGLTEG